MYSFYKYQIWKDAYMRFVNKNSRRLNLQIFYICGLKKNNNRFTSLIYAESAYAKCESIFEMSAYATENCLICD